MKRIKSGDIVRIQMPWSEACMYLHVTDQMRDVHVLDNAAQILNDDGTKYSFPLTHGEVGIFRDADGLYIHEGQT